MRLPGQITSFKRALLNNYGTEKTRTAAHRLDKYPVGKCNVFFF